MCALSLWAVTMAAYFVLINVYMRAWGQETFFICMSTYNHICFLKRYRKMNKNLLKRTPWFCYNSWKAVLFHPLSLLIFDILSCKTFTIWNSTLKQLCKLCRHNIDPNFVCLFVFFFTNLVSVVSYEKSVFGSIGQPCFGKWSSGREISKFVFLDLCCFRSKTIFLCM